MRSRRTLPHMGKVLLAKPQLQRVCPGTGCQYQTDDRIDDAPELSYSPCQRKYMPAGELLQQLFRLKPDPGLSRVRSDCGRFVV